MVFDLDHWKEPRKTIGNNYKDNDVSYALRAAKNSAIVLKQLNLPPSELAKMTILDYGCGTGTMVKVLANYFKASYGYDPQPACMKACLEESPEFIVRRAHFILPEYADVCTSVHVIEHLPEETAREVMEKMFSISPTVVVWYHSIRNEKLIAEYATKEQMEKALCYVGKIRVMKLQRK